MAIFHSIEGWYNPAGLHQSLDYQPPFKYEKQDLDQTLAA
jgi:transposase InsO family protein